jgi:uncharacterized protein YgiM (DUF1202 family)
MRKTTKSTLILAAAGVLLLGAHSSEALAETVETTQTARVMARPGEKARVLTRVDAGTSLRVLETQGRWIKVRANGRTGWIMRSSVATPTAKARSSVRNTRRRPFVEGRSTQRGATRRAPVDRVGADATEDEFLDDDFDDFDDGDGADMGDSDEKIVVARAETELLAKPSLRSESVTVVRPGRELYVIRESSSGDWILVEDDDGDSGWIRSSEVRGSGFSYPKMVKRAGARIGYSTRGSTFASNGQGELANYGISSAAAALSVGGELIYNYKPRYLILAEATYTGTRANPGIRFQNEMGQVADIGFLIHEIDVGGGVGYNFQSPTGMVAYGRVGYHYGNFGINDVGDFQQNLARLPSEILKGVTIGARLDIPKVRDDIGIYAGVDALYFEASRTQTTGLEDGALSEVFALWGNARVIYQWKPDMTLEGAYRYSMATTDWLGAAPGSMRPHNATEAARKDVSHTLSVGLGKQF